MNVTDPLEDHRKHLYSFYLACNILNSSSRSDESFNNDIPDTDSPFLPFLHFGERSTHESSQDFYNRSIDLNATNDVRTDNVFLCDDRGRGQNVNFKCELLESKWADIHKESTPSEKLNVTGREEIFFEFNEGRPNFIEHPSTENAVVETSGPEDADQEGALKEKELRTFECYYCNKVFKLKRSLRKHISRCLKPRVNTSLTREEQRRWKKSSKIDKTCTLCGHVARKPCELKLHMTAKHTSERPYTCKECGIGFTSTSKLNRHIKNKVHAKGKFYCELCKIYFSVEVNYDRHKADHTLPIDKIKPYVCFLCEKRFSRIDILRKHIDVHTRDERSLFQCITCNRTFSRKDTLVHHISKELCR